MASTIVASYDFECDTWTTNGDNPTRQAWRQAVAEIADKAKAKLPECSGRVDRGARHGFTASHTRLHLQRGELRRVVHGAARRAQCVFQQWRERGGTRMLRHRGHWHSEQGDRADLRRR